MFIELNTQEDVVIKSLSSNRSVKRIFGNQPLDELYGILRAGDQVEVHNALIVLVH